MKRKRYSPPRILEHGADVNVFKILLEHDGPRCAAWLVKEFKVQFRRTGAIELLVASDKQEPLWFRLAIACLKQRKSFEVKQTKETSCVKYLVTWLRKDWGKHGKHEAWSVKNNVTC